MTSDSSTPSGKLWEVLSVARSHPSIAHFLFSEKHAQFHSLGLPPALFSSSLCVRLSHSYTPLSGGANGEGALDMLFVPAGMLHGALVGYTFVRSAGGVAVMRGRFAAEEGQRHCINVIHGLTSSTSGLVAVTRASENINVRRFFTIPNRVYSYDHLPNSVLAILENVEYRQTPPPPPPLPDPLDLLLGDVGALPSLEVDSLLDIDTAAPVTDTAAPVMDPVAPVMNPAAPGVDGVWSRDDHAPGAPFTTGGSAGVLVEWFDTRQRGEQSFEADEYGEVAAYRDGRDLSGMSLDLSAIREALTGIERTLAGDYWGPRVATDIFETNGALLACETGSMRAWARTWDARGLREVAAFGYYATAALADRPLSGGLDMDMDSDDAGGSAQGTASTTLSATESEGVPATVSIAPAVTQCTVEPVVESAMDAEVVAATRREAKKRYNRLSAARSIARKKERVAEQERELAELKQRVPELTETLQRLRNENVQLRHACQSRTPGDS